MKKIRKKSDVEKEQEKKQKILCLVLGFLLLISTLGYSLMNRESNDSSSSETQVEFYKGTKFVLDSYNYWEMNYENNTIFFNYLPNELENITLTYNGTLSDFRNSVFYYTGSENTRLLSNMNSFVDRLQKVKLEENDENIPLKDCLSSTKIVVFEQANETSVYQKNNCIYISGDISKAADLFMYKILGVADGSGEENK